MNRLLPHLLSSRGIFADAPLSLPRKIEILFIWGQLEGVSTSYASIAKGSVKSASIKEIHRGKNQNPGLDSLLALAEHFGIHLDYFEARTEEECWTYLETASKVGKPMEGSAPLTAANKRFVEHISNLLTLKLLTLQQESSSSIAKSKTDIEEKTTP